MGFGKFIGNITKSVGKAFQKITPWNDKSEGLFGIGKITPWNDKDGNVVGNMLTGLTLAAAIAGGMHLLNAGKAATTTTTATANATSTSAVPKSFSLTYTPEPVTYRLGNFTITNPVTGEVLIRSSTIPPTAIFGSKELTLAGLGHTGVSTMGALTSGATAGAVASSTPSSLWGTLTSKNVLPYTIMGGAMLTGGGIQGLGSYLAAKENAKTQREALALQREQFDQQHTYGGSGVGEYLLRNMNKPTIRTAITTAQDAYLKMVSDPAYRQGFISAASKFIHPDVASQINDFINNNSSQARLYTLA